MTLVHDLPWLRILRPDCDGLVADVAAPCQCHDVPADPAALVLAAEGVAASHVVLVLPDVVPRTFAGGLSADTALMTSGRALLWPAQNDMTGEATPTHGLWVVPAQMLRDRPEAFIGASPAVPTVPVLVIPRLAATWMCGRSAEAAFRAGFALMEVAETPAAALSAGLGSDRPNGVWWGVGACHALLGGGADTAWTDAQDEALDAASLQLRWHELARRVRVETGLPVHPVDAHAASALRRMRGDVVSAPIWDKFVAGLRELGPDAARLYTAYGAARTSLWGYPADGG